MPETDDEGVEAVRIPADIERPDRLLGLSKNGIVRQVSDTPRRYQHVTTGQTTPAGSEGGQHRAGRLPAPPRDAGNRPALASHAAVQR